MQKQAAEAMLNYLQSNINEETSLAEMVNVFERMCRLPTGIDPAQATQYDDMRLFELGTYDLNCTGEPLFYCNLTRQIPNGTGEFYQVQMKAIYAPSKATRWLRRAVWSTKWKDRFFANMRKSKGFQKCKDMPMLKRSLCLEET